MCSGRDDGQLRPPGFPIRKSSDHSLVAGSPRLIAGSNVLHRLLVPRHPPCALINLATTIDARVHCAVLKIRPAPAPHPRIRGGRQPVQRDQAPRPVPSGPNSVPAQPPAPPPRPPPGGDGPDHRYRDPKPITRCPPLRCPPGTPGPDLA